MSALAVLAACGSNHASSIDGALPGSDAATGPDAPATGLVTIAVTGANPVSGLTVVFADPSGAPTVTTTTDANGSASATVVAGSSVVVAVPTTSTPSLYYVLDIQPGDQLAITIAASQTPTSLGTAAITLPGTYPNAASYTTDIGCSHTSTTTAGQVSLAVRSNCLNATQTYDAVARALDSNGTPIAYSLLSGLTAPQSGQSTSVTLPAWTTSFAGQLSATDAPSNTSQITAVQRPCDGPVCFQGLEVTQALAAQGSTTIALPEPMGPWTSYTTQTMIARAGSVPAISERLSNPSTPTSTVDLTTDLLPFVHDPSIDPPTATSGFTVHWSSDAPQTNALGMLALIDYTTTANTTAAIFAEYPAGTALTGMQALPPLPAALSAYAPSSAPPSSVGVIAVGGDQWSGPTAFREGWTWILGASSTPPTKTVLAALGAAT
jgi:hypothetical protein